MQGAGGEVSEVQAGYAFHALQTAPEEAKIFSEKQKGFRDGLSYVLRPSKKERNAITYPRSHPIPKFYLFLMGWATCISYDCT